MQLVTVRIEKPEAVNFIFGQTHFIKSVEDLHEALVGAVPGIKFGLAFCEASGKCLVRWSGTDPAMAELARANARAIAAGHTFIVFLGVYAIGNPVELLVNPQADSAERARAAAACPRSAPPRRRASRPTPRTS